MSLKIKTLIKSTVLYAPMAGLICFLALPIWVPRGTAFASRRIIVQNRCLALLNANIPILYFPEGTRRLYGRLQPFKTGVFELALKHRIALYSCVIHGSHIAYPPRSLRVRPQTIYLNFDDFVYVPTEDSSVELLINVVRDRFVELSRAIPLYNERIERPINSSEELRQIKCAASKVDKYRSSLLIY